MSKIILSVLMSASMLFAGVAAAQSVPVPEDTTARVASNLVNQVSAANFKAVAEHPALASNILSQAAASSASEILKSSAASYARRQALADAALAVALKSFNEIGPKEAMSLAETLSANQAKQSMQLLQALNAGGLGNKSMMTVPPVSVPNPAAGQ